MTIVCPLSGNRDVVLVEKIKTADLIAIYDEILNIDVSSEFAEIKELGFYHSPESDLRFFYPTVTGTEPFYEKLQRFEWYYMDEKSEYEFANKFILDSDSVLEVGCGKGAFAKKISAKNYVGLEFSQKATEIATNNGLTVLNESIQEHALNNPAAYDIVCSFQVLEHVSEVGSFIESCVSCLKSGGKLIYSVPSADSFLSITRNSATNMPPHHISWWSDKSLAYIGNKYGLKLIGIEHEKLADVHKEWYASAVTLEGLRNLFGVDIPLIDRSLKYRVLAKIARFGGQFLKRCLTDDRILPNGHSVTVVYQKNGI